MLSFAWLISAGLIGKFLRDESQGLERSVAELARAPGSSSAVTWKVETTTGTRRVSTNGSVHVSLRRYITGESLLLPLAEQEKDDDQRRPTTTNDDGAEIVER